MTLQRNNCDTVGSFGQPTRRGPLSEGDRVQVRDPKGRFHQIILVRGGRFQSNRGGFDHDDIIGAPDGQVIVTDEGRQFQILRPLQVDYVMSMPRGAAVVYPKDAGVITHMGDIFPGARVVEAGAGSGALSMTPWDPAAPSSQSKGAKTSPTSRRPTWTCGSGVVIRPGIFASAMSTWSLRA